MPRKIAVVVGARPNFMKAAPLMEELHKHPDKLQPLLIHTGQHYDHKLSQLFFDELGMPKPDIYLGIGSASHAVQTAKIMIETEQVFLDQKPELVVVFGDVNSTMAAAIVAAKLHIPTAHVEAGLRSYDNKMPEEINRIVTDRIAQYLFVSESSGLDNLRREGTDEDKIFFTGNIMIDSLVRNLSLAEKSGILESLKLKPRSYVAMTLHRPATVDNKSILGPLLRTLNEIGERIPIILPCHPRTTKMIEQFGLGDTIDAANVRIVEPLGYLDFLKLQSNAHFVLTDSGGIQEETTYLNIPCITLRDNTERPATVNEGSNVITGTDPGRIRTEADKILSGNGKKGTIPKYWDGHTAERILAILLEKLA